MAAKFDSVLRDSLGRRLHGRFLALSEANPSRLLPTKRLFVTASPFTFSGDVVIAPDGSRHLLAEGPTKFHSGEKTFKTVVVDRQLPVERAADTVHAVTGVKVKGAPAVVATIEAYLEPREQRLDRSAHLSLDYERWVLITGYPLRRDDVVGGRYRIVRVDRVAGLYLCEAE